MQIGEGQAAGRPRIGIRLDLQRERAGVVNIVKRAERLGKVVMRVTAAIEDDGNRYYCVVWDRVGQKITTEPALLSVLQPMEIPQTGDDTSLWLLLAAAAVSGAVLIVLWRRRR